MKEGRSLLEMKGIVRRFPGVLALDRVDFSVKAGEIHALMGENGAGKSTLIKVLTGVHPPQEGTIRFDGRVIQTDSPRDAETKGISTVFQEVNLIPGLSIAENILLGRLPTRMGMIQWGEVRRRARIALDRLGFKVDVTRPLGNHAMAVQQMVAIARAIDLQAKLLILDEPTSSLDAEETRSLFEVLRKLRDEGMAMIFVSHFLDQVFDLSDRMTVLRNGRLVGTFETANLSRLSLIGHMLGKDTEAVSQHLAPALRQQNAGNEATVSTLLSARELGLKGSMPAFNLDLPAAQVTGLAGLLGSGRTETARLLFGADTPQTGSLQFRGKTLRLGSPAAAIAAGMAFCSEDRRVEGIFPNLSVRENLILALQAGKGVFQSLGRAESGQLADHYIQALSIKTPTPETPIRNLSGGNQQKVLLARWLAMHPKLIILDEPTRGIDIGAKSEIRELVLKLRGEGMAVLFISSEMEEILEVADQVILLKDRKKVGTLEGESLTEPAIMKVLASHESEEVSE